MPPETPPETTVLPPDITAIIPCYNAGDRVRPVALGVLSELPRLIIVDDGSTDTSIDSLRDLPVNIVTLSPNRGKGHALLAGIQRALQDPQCACICLLDADGQHNPEEIPRLYQAFRESGADLVIGARVFSGGHIPLRSRFGNKVTILATALLLRHRLPDTQCGFRLLSRAFAERVLEAVEGGRYETEMAIIALALRERHTIVSVPISTIYEQGNVSSHFRKFQDSYRIYARLVRAGWVAWMRPPKM
jgi:glycosyltransferase involved in cell wall biosynthesis